MLPPTIFQLTTTAIFAASLCFVGCGSDSTDASPSDTMNGGGGESAPVAAINILGDYADESGTHGITDTSWEQGYAGNSLPALYEFVKVSNEEKFAIAKNGVDNEYSAGLFSRFDWTWHDDGLYYCQSAYDAADIGAAEAVGRADDSKPAESGCGGAFPWTRLSPAGQLPFQGEYTDAATGLHGIDGHIWTQTYGESTGRFTFTQVVITDDSTGHVISRNDDDNEFSAGLWSRMDWRVQDGGYWYCQTVYDAATASAAAEPARADESDIENTGCGGEFPWSLLTQVEGD